MGKPITEKERCLNIAANEEIKEIISKQMADNNVGAKEVAQRMTDMGRPISEQGLRNAISCGTHKTTWYFDLLKAINLDKQKD